LATDRKKPQLTAGKKNSGFTGISGISTRINFVSVDMEVTPKSATFLTRKRYQQA
jgi:hypothetical protein